MYGHFSVQLIGCRNIHALFIDLLHRSFYIPKRNRTLISSIAVLPSDLAMLYHMLDAQLFLQPQLVAHREHNRFSNVSSASARTSATFFGGRIRHTKTEYVVVFRQNHPVSNCGNQFASYDYFVRKYGLAGRRTNRRSELYRLSAAMQMHLKVSDQIT